MSDLPPPEEGAPPATWAGRRRAAAEDGPADDEFLYEEDHFEDDELEFAEEDDEADEPEPPGGNGAAQATIEADTLALADSEEAKEAALAGLRARTQERAAKLKTGTTPTPPEAPRAVAPPPPAPPPATPPPPRPPAEEAAEPPRRALWPRFVAASFLIVVSMATATAVSLLVYLTDIAKGLGGLEVRGLTEVESGEPQNFLILGSDKRENTPGDPGRSDTTILLRINPDEDVITLMSVPRDLEVNIPGHGVDKFNAAYSYGGPQLTLKTVQQLTKNRIPVNHIVNIDFLGFADAVNAIGCVYVDVDRHYYIPPNSGVAEIDIQAGYQRLCGLKALQYVRYRHTDNDLVRSARQQDFLREARAAVPTSKLLNDSNDLIDIFTKYTESDIKKPATLITLLKLMIAARGAPVQEIHFPTTSLDENGYVTSDNALIENAVSRFLDPTPETSASSEGGGKGGKEKPKPQKPDVPQPAPDLIDSTSSGQLYANALAEARREEGDPMLDFPVFYPTLLAPESTISDESRAFVIDGPGDEVYHGYRFVVSAPGSFGAPAYYGISGTDWKDPPLLDNPSEEREIDGRTYSLYYDGDRLRLVSFKTDQASYWVINSLTQELDAGQMIGIAEGLREYTG